MTSVGDGWIRGFGPNRAQDRPKMKFFKFYEKSMYETAIKGSERVYE